MSLKNRKMQLSQISRLFSKKPNVNAHSNEKISRGAFALSHLTLKALMSFLFFSFTSVSWGLSEVEIRQAATQSKSVEEFLNHLPDSSRSQFTLIYKGVGLQGSSEKAPRILLFDSKGANYLTVTTDPALAGGTSVEWLNYTQERGFELREIFFLPAPSKPNAVEIVREAKTLGLEQSDVATARGAVIFGKPSSGQSVITAPNPGKCLKCHQSLSSVVHPIWNSYPHWPGVVGSIDDQLFSFKPSIEEGVHVPWSQFGSSPDRQAPYKEFQLLKDYEKLREKNPRLAALRDWDQAYERKTTKDFEGEPNFEAQARNLSPLMNTRITTLLMVSFAEQLARRWVTTDFFKKNKHIIFSGAYCQAKKLAPLVPQSMRQEFDRLSQGQSLFGDDKFASRRFVREWLMAVGVERWPEELHFDQSLPSGDTGVNSGIETTELFLSSQNYISGWILALAFKKSYPDFGNGKSAYYQPYSSFLERYQSKLSPAAIDFLKRLDSWSDSINYDQLQDVVCPQFTK